MDIPDELGWHWDDIRWISNFQEAYTVRSFQLHPLRSSRRGELSIRLTGRWRLIVTKGSTEESLIIEEVSDHYDN